MRQTRNFTVVLHNDEAAKISHMLGDFGGTVGGFCASVVRDYIELSPDQITQVREQIRTLAKTSREKREARWLNGAASESAASR